MTTLEMDRTSTPPKHAIDVSRVSTWFGVAFTAAQATVMISMAAFVLPRDATKEPTDVTPSYSYSAKIFGVSAAVRYDF